MNFNQIKSDEIIVYIYRIETRKAYKISWKFGIKINTFNYYQFSGMRSYQKKKNND